MSQLNLTGKNAAVSIVFLLVITFLTLAFISREPKIQDKMWDYFGGGLSGLYLMLNISHPERQAVSVVPAPDPEAQ